ncbi:response regulator [Ruminiclostridium cellobioparum]|uniref:response regulator n=1 Tax=Ruminiclostridium cellobioparum TaxID=29355 RepID=UPI000486B5E0|nr:response regulator [Ruminiclostridium cellobioparum]
MNKLLIADDDEIICRGLSKCIDWEKYGLDIVGAVYDGEVALQYVERYKPDIVIVDINMPFVDGIEFSYIMKERYPEIKIIILTAHKEFEYAKHAIALQVFSYITKPFSNQEVIETVVNASKEIEKEKQRRKDITANISAIREKYLEDLIVNGVIDDERIEMCNIASKDSHFQTAILYFESLSSYQRPFQELAIDSVINARELNDKIKSRLEKYTNLKMFSIINRVVILKEYKSKDEHAGFEDHLQNLIFSLKNEVDLLIFCGIGRIYHGIYEIHFSYNEAIKALEESYNFGNKSIVLYEESQQNSAEYQVKLQIYKNKICGAIQGGNYESMEVELLNMFEKVKKSRMRNIPFFKVMMVELILSSYKAAEEEVYAQLIGEVGLLVRRLMQANNLLDIERIVSDCFKKLSDCLESRNQSENRQVVKLAMNYMKKDFDNPDLMLKDVAEKVHISANYLSSLFKRFEDNSFINCLNNIRLGQAKKLLVNREVKMYEVAFRSGFNSSQYFSSCFKKSTGMTPSEYRQKYLK